MEDKSLHARFAEVGKELEQNETKIQGERSAFGKTNPHVGEERRAPVLDGRQLPREWPQVN